MSTLQTGELYRFIGRYKFVISYENSACDDYITEKLWRPLSLGVVPIYFGSPNIQVDFRLSDMEKYWRKNYDSFQSNGLFTAMATQSRFSCVD